MGLTLPPLPYPVTALQPYLKPFSIERHREFERKYIATVNERAAPYGTSNLIELALKASAAGDEKLSHAAAQVWNHEFYWHSMRPVDGSHSVPEGPLSNLIRKQFGGLATLRDHFVQAGLDQFGSGYVWLTMRRGREIAVEITANADNPLIVGGGFPLICCDIWEHAWIADYDTDREFYLSTWFDMMANFAFGSDNARGALSAH